MYFIYIILSETINCHSQQALPLSFSNWMCLLFAELVILLEAEPWFNIRSPGFGKVFQVNIERKCYKSSWTLAIFWKDVCLTKLLWYFVGNIWDFGIKLAFLKQWVTSLEFSSENYGMSSWGAFGGYYHWCMCTYHWCMCTHHCVPFPPMVFSKAMN